MLSYMSSPGNRTQQHTDSTKRSVPGWKRTYNALVCTLPSQHSIHYASQAVIFYDTQFYSIP